MAERAALGAGDRVCDVGCGYGGPARSFVGRGARVVGVTLSGAQAVHARRRAGSERRVRHRTPASFAVADWLDNPFPEACFDVVVAIESASHMADKPKFLTECHRVLAPGGRLAVAAWLAAEAPPRWARRFLLEPVCDEGRLPGLASESEYRRWMDDAGFEVTSFDDLSRAVRRTWTLCVGRLARRLIGDAEARRYLLDARRSERVFAAAVARIWLAYRVGALRYGVFGGVARSAR